VPTDSDTLDLIVNYFSDATDYFINNKLDLNFRDAKGQTLLMHASRRLDIYAIGKLLGELGVDPTIQDKEGRDALTHAVEWSRFDAH
jgi:ankyrin repeat protein